MVNRELLETLGKFDLLKSLNKKSPYVMNISMILAYGLKQCIVTEYCKSILNKKLVLSLK